MPGPMGVNNHLNNTQVNDTAIEVNAAAGSKVNVEVVNNNVSNVTQPLYPEPECCCCDGAPQPAHESPDTGIPLESGPGSGTASYGKGGQESAQDRGWLHQAAQTIGLLKLLSYLEAALAWLWRNPE